MVHVTVSCPKCKKTVYSSTGRSYFYGSPIRTCPYCNHSFTHFQFHEIAVEGIRKRDQVRLTYGEIIQLITAIAFLAIPAYFTYTAFLDGSKTDNVGLALLVILGMCLPSIILGMSPIMGLANYKKRMEELRRETSLSEKRLQNPEYARQLAKLGYNVPIKYLDVSENKIKEAIQSGPSDNEHLDKFSEIEKYKELLDKGIITKEEFEKKKNQLLDI